MISKTYILENLRRLDVEYRRAVHPKHVFYFSKLSILELCGWIEMSMDDIITTHGNRKLVSDANRKFVRKDIVGRTNGFDYHDHFRIMLIRLIGVVSVESIENNLDQNIQAQFIAELGNLRSIRNSLAHTYVKHISSIDAPSVTKARFAPLYAGLKAYDDALRSM